MGLAWSRVMLDGLCRPMGFISALCLSVAVLHFLLECDIHPLSWHLAAGTIKILQRQVQQPASRWAWLAALCCWPFKARDPQSSLGEDLS